MESIFKFSQVRSAVKADIEYVIKITEDDIKYVDNDQGAGDFFDLNDTVLDHYEDAMRSVTQNSELISILSYPEIISNESSNRKKLIACSKLIEKINKIKIVTEKEPTTKFVKMAIVATINQKSSESQKNKLKLYYDYLKICNLKEYLHKNLSKKISLENFNYLYNAPILLPESVGKIGGSASNHFHVPHTFGSIKPTGVADLKIVKQQLKGYETGEIVNIENILKGEVKSKNITISKTTEDYIYTETENTSSSEITLETNDRFEVSQAASEAIGEDASYHAGVAISSSWGPTKFSADADANFSNSKNTSTETASEYAKEVTQKAVEKITERQLRVESRKIIQSYEDKTSHEFNNIGGNAHITGIYQWVDKIYEAQIYNYGKRQMYDIMIPEPAAYYVNSNAPVTLMDLPDKPEEINFNTSDINDDNYRELISRYGVSSVSAPPQKTISKSEVMQFSNVQKDEEQVNTAKIAIDDGYVPVQAEINYLVNEYSDKSQPWFLNVAVGSWQRIIAESGEKDEQDSGLFTTPDAGQEYRYYGKEVIPLMESGGELSCSLLTFRIGTASVSIHVKCERNENSYQAWQLEVYGAILNAYNEQQSAYEDATNQSTLFGLAEIGKNPLENRKIIDTELKKHAITILTNQNFRHFDSIRENDRDKITNNDEEIDVNESIQEGKYVRFFENAFEWQNMTYSLYPYFWGRKNKWIEKINTEESDQLFKDFVQSGFCRLALPVRPGFESAISFFMNTGEVWEGGNAPIIGDEAYVSVAQELSEKIGRAQGEIAEGEPWEFRVPTSLIKLRKDDELPEWEKDDDGIWIEKVKK